METAYQVTGHIARITLNRPVRERDAPFGDAGPSTFNG
jgi:hypothetical protein